MRILYFSQYFPPEAGATQTRAYEMARNWVKMGNHVTIITEFPNHPSGIIPEKYRGKICECSMLDDISVIRVWVKASPIKNFINRMSFYLSYMTNAIIAGLFLIHGKIDLIYASSPPLFVGGAAMFISFMKRTPMVFEVRDLWPESAIALGELNNPIFIKLATRLEQACYQKALRVVVVTNGILNHLQEKGLPPEKILLIPNGANVDLFQLNLEKRQVIRKQLNAEKKFIVIYAGVFGIAQGLDTIITVAQHLQRDHEDIQFLLIGDGPKKHEILHSVQQLQLMNIAIINEQPRESIPAYLSAADVALIPLRNIDIFKGALPSKIFDAWACNLPVIISIDGEARLIVEKANGGIYTPPEDAQKMVEAIIAMKNSPSEREKMGKNGRDFTMKYYSRESLAKSLINKIEESLGR